MHFRCSRFERAQADQLSVGLTTLCSADESQLKEIVQEEPKGFQQLQAEPAQPLRQASTFAPVAGDPRS